jgi:large subunit ribosomal protein L28
MLMAIAPKASWTVSRIWLSAKASFTVACGGWMEGARVQQQPNFATSNIQVRYRSNRSRRGLYDGKDIRSGNNVSFSMRHTKRKFRPNVFIKRVYSEILDDMIPFHITTSALRSIDKAGGLDNYLLKNDITEGEGFKIKKNILKRLKNQAYFAKKVAEKAATEDFASNQDAALNEKLQSEQMGV